MRDRAKDMGGRLRGKTVFSGKPSGSRTDTSWLQDERDANGQIWWRDTSPAGCCGTITKAAMSSTRLSIVLDVVVTNCTMWRLFWNHYPLRSLHSSFHLVKKASFPYYTTVLFNFGLGLVKRCWLLSVRRHLFNIRLSFLSYFCGKCMYWCL